MSSPSFPAIRLPHLDQVPLPAVRRARLAHPRGEVVRDPEAVVARALEGAERLAALPQGARVAIAVGSRGIAAIPAIVRAVVAGLHERGLVPFVVPAMGSHGGGEAESQKRLLAGLGVTEEAVGCPVRATMETRVLGHTEDGIPCHIDRHAAEADAIVVVNRVKSHTSFPRDVESGLTKMVAVGLGKAEGARNVHKLGGPGLQDVLPALAAIAIEKAPIAFGIAVVENADKDLVAVEGAAPESFLEADARLLRLAKSLLPRLPFSQLDVLAVEVLGKNISGAGMDYAVIGRTDLRGYPNPETPFVHKLTVHGITPESHGNGMGVGVADYTTKAVADALDLEAMYLNAVTATYIEKARIPVVLADDAQALKAACATCWRLDPENARLALIRSTLHLDEILVSQPLADELASDDRATIVGEPEPIRFDGDGTLTTRV
jgi:hypothetical protein